MGGLNTTQNQHLEKDLGANFPDGIRFVGFENKGNICYSNSTIQCLYYCPAFREKISKAKAIDGVPAAENPILILQELFNQLNNFKKKTGCIATKKLMSFVRKKNDIFKGDYHQDCHEFLMWYLNEIDDVLNKQQKQIEEKNNKGKQNSNTEEKKPKKLNWLEEIFQGKQITQTHCDNCKTVTEREEPFFDLSLDIECNASLSHCIKQMSQPEILKDDDKFWCDKCEKLQEATKKVLIKQFPETFIIHLKRFKYDETQQRMKKLQWKIAFPVDIKLQTNYNEESAEEQYDLYGIVIHHGQGIQYGHYQALIKIKYNWYLFDDENISMLNENELESIFGSNHFSGCAYMLFYQKRNSTTKQSK